MNLRYACSAFTSWLVASVVVLLSSSLEAASPRSPRLVLPRTAEVRLLDERQQPQPIPAGLLLDVLRADNGYYWVGRGWVLQTEVVGLEEAVEHFTAAIEAKPTAYAYVARARARVQLNAPQEAAADCRAALKLAPNYAPAHCQLGRAQTALRQPNAALESLDRAIALDDRSAVSYCCRAQTRQAMGDSASALADYDRAIELDDQLVVAFFQRAGVHSQLGDEPAALTDLIEVLIRHPDHFLALNNRANIFANREEWDRAISDYTAALKVAVRPDIYVNRARALQALGRALEALADCNEALRLNPQDERGYRQRAALLMELGRMEEAGVDLKYADRLTADSRT